MSAMNMRGALTAVLALSIALTAESFADWMTKDFCDRELSVGMVIMNNKVESSTDRYIKVFRGEEELTSGSEYNPKESLTVSISDPSNQYVYEAIGGAMFIKGGCDGRRLANKPKAILVMPATGSATISIHAGWAQGHEAVSLSNDFVLVPSGGENRRLSIDHHIAQHHRNEHANIADPLRNDPLRNPHDLLARHLDRVKDSSHRAPPDGPTHPHDPIALRHDPLYGQIHDPIHDSRGIGRRDADAAPDMADGGADKEGEGNGEKGEYKEGEMEAEKDGERDGEKGPEDNEVEDKIKDVLYSKDFLARIMQERGQALPSHPLDRHPRHPLDRDPRDPSYPLARHSPLDPRHPMDRDPMDRNYEDPARLLGRGRLPDHIQGRFPDTGPNAAEEAEERRRAAIGDHVPAPQADAYAHRLHRDRDELRQHRRDFIEKGGRRDPPGGDREGGNEDERGNERERGSEGGREGDRGGNEGAREGGSDHPHSPHEEDHDFFDLARKKEMDKVRDRELFQGKKEQLAIIRDKQTEEIERNAIHGHKASYKKNKVALRGGTSYSEYVRTHTVLVAEYCAGGVLLLFCLFRLFSNRFKIHRYVKKMKGHEEK